MKRLITYTFFFLQLCFTLSAVSCAKDDSQQLISPLVQITSINPEVVFPGKNTTTITFAILTTASDSDVHWKLSFGDGEQIEGSGKLGSASHMYKNAGSYSISVSASVGELKSEPATTIYQVQSPVDLIAVDANATPVAISAGDKLSFSAAVKNSSSAPVSSSVDIEAFITKDSHVKKDDRAKLISLGRMTLNKKTRNGFILDPSSDIVTSKNFVSPPGLDSGVYYPAFLIDPDNKIADTQTANNFVVGKRIIQVNGNNDNKLDLSVSNFVYAPDRAFPELGVVTRSFDITNLSNVDVYDITFKVYLSVGDSNIDKNDTVIDSGAGIEIGPRAQVNIPPKKIPLSNVIPGTATPTKVWLIVVVSAPNAFKESALNNNTAVSEPPITVTNQAVTGPDISVETLIASPKQTYIGGPLNIETKISNQGTKDIGSFFCGVYLTHKANLSLNTDTRLGTINVTSLAAGANDTIHSTLYVSSLFSPGDYFTYIYCDPVGSIEEAFRSNNKLIDTKMIHLVSSSDIDLVADFKSLPPSVNEGDLSNITVQVCAHGTTPSLQTKGGFNASFGSFPNNHFDALFDIPSLEPNKCTDINIPITFDCKDFQNTLFYRVQIDTENENSETDESNTFFSTSSTLISGKYCSCNQVSPEPAHNITSAHTPSSNTVHGAICSSEPCDYYKIPMNAGDSLFLNLNQQVKRGTITAKIYSGDGLTEFDRTLPKDDSRAALYNVANGGNYVVAICADPNQKNYYTFDYHVVPKPATPDLIPGPPSVNVFGSVSIGAIVDVTTEIFNIGDAAQNPFVLKYELSDDPSFSSTNVLPLGTLSFPQIGATTSETVTKSVEIPRSLSDGTYYIRITLDSSNTISEDDETNNQVVSEPFVVKTVCYDPLEPNDTFGTPALVTSKTYNNLVICNGQRDYYKICAKNGQTLSAAIHFDNTKADLDLELYDASSHLLAASSNNNAHSESVSLDYVNGDQCYILSVNLVFSQEQQPHYSLEVHTQDVPPAEKCDSYFEPNDQFDTALSLLSAINASLPIDRCPIADKDLYYVSLSTGQTVNFSAKKEPEHQSGTLRLQVFGPSQLPMKYAETGPGIPIASILNFVAPSSGMYYLQVTFTGNQRKRSYSLQVTGIQGVDLKPSNFSIGYGTYSPGDEVRYRFDLNNLLSSEASGASYNLYLSNDNLLDSNDIPLLPSDASLNNLLGFAKMTAGGKFNLPSSVSAGSYFLILKIIDTLDKQPDNNIVSTSLIVVN